MEPQAQPSITPEPSQASAPELSGHALPARQAAEQAIDYRLSPIVKQLEQALSQLSGSPATIQPVKRAIDFSVRHLECMSQLLPESALLGQAQSCGADLGRVLDATLLQSSGDLEPLRRPLEAFACSARALSAEIDARIEPLRKDPECAMELRSLESRRESGFHVPAKASYENGELVVTGSVFHRVFELYRGKIELPPGLELTVLADDTLRLTDTQGALFHMTHDSNRIRAGQSEPGRSVFFHPHISLEGQGFQITGWSMHIPHTDRWGRMGQFSTGCNDLQSRIREVMDQMLLPHEFAHRESVIACGSFSVKVKGPSRQGEVELSDVSYSGTAHTLYYNPQTKQIRLPDHQYSGWPGKLLGVEGSLEDGSCLITVSGSYTAKGYDRSAQSKYKVELIKDNWHCADSVRIYALKG